MYNLFITNRGFSDLNPVVAGEQRCAPGYSFGPAVRRYTLIHYVVSGKGVLYNDTGAHTVEAGQAFVILPGQVTVYTADSEDPWHYAWIGFDGSLSQRFSELGPVISMEKEPFLSAVRASREAVGVEYSLTAALFTLYGQLFVATNVGNLHVKRVQSYIQAEYMKPIRVELIARELNLDRRYLSRLFKEKTGSTIQDYLITVRMKEAQRCLRQGYSVKDTAAFCGYEDVPNFSRMFRQYFGVSPVQWKKQEESL